MEQDRKHVEQSFWAKLKPLIGKLPFTHDLLSAYYCAFDEETPLRVKAILFASLAYFVLPVDLIPDFIPVLGFTDDAAALAAAIASVKGAITDDHRKAATREFQNDNGT
jgi:uncharacterized membrane protein YkvA (DUF1232 family)